MYIKFNDNKKMNILDVILEQIPAIRHYMFVSFFVNRMEDDKNHDSEWCKYEGAKEGEDGKTLIAFRFFNIHIIFICAKDEKNNELVVEDIAVQECEKAEENAKSDAK